MPESATAVAPVGSGASDQPRVASGPSASGSARAVEKGWPLRLGVLTAQIGPALVDEVVAAAGGAPRRGAVFPGAGAGAPQRGVRLSPARAVVSFVLGLYLFSGAEAPAPPGYQAVARSVTNGL